MRLSIQYGVLVLKARFRVCTNQPHKRGTTKKGLIREGIFYAADAGLREPKSGEF